MCYCSATSPSFPGLRSRRIVKLSRYELQAINDRTTVSGSMATNKFSVAILPIKCRRVGFRTRTSGPSGSAVTAHWASICPPKTSGSVNARTVQSPSFPPLPASLMERWYKIGCMVYTRNQSKSECSLFLHSSFSHEQGSAYRPSPQHTEPPREHQG